VPSGGLPWLLGQDARGRMAAHEYPQMFGAPFAEVDVTRMPKRGADQPNERLLQ